MSLLLCRRERVKHPFYIEVLGIHIYSSQELCYVIYHHPLLVMNDFVDASLFFFVKNELGLGFLAGRMEKLVEAGGRPEEALYLFLSECDYYTEKEIQKFKQVTASYRNLSQNASCTAPSAGFPDLPAPTGRGTSHRPLCLWRY